MIGKSYSETAMAIFCRSPLQYWTSILSPSCGQRASQAKYQHFCCFLDLLTIGCEDAGSVPLQNISKLLPACLTLQPRRQCWLLKHSSLSSSTVCWSSASSFVTSSLSLRASYNFLVLQLRTGSLAANLKTSAVWTCQLCTFSSGNRTLLSFWPLFSVGFSATTDKFHRVNPFKNHCHAKMSSAVRCVSSSLKNHRETEHKFVRKFSDQSL